MESKNIPLHLRQDLKAASDEKTRAGGKRYFREEVKLHGVKSRDSRAINQKYDPEIMKLSKAEVFTIAEELLKGGYAEEQWIAADWLDRIHALFTKDDFETFERFINTYVTNWATCDTLCNHAVGSLVDMYPELLPRLMKWTKSDNRWVKRASAVTLILPARNGKFLDEVFAIADILLLDQDDMVQKGYGWLLKEASRKHQKEVYDYVVRNKANMPRTALRYAIEKMPPNLRTSAMKK